MTGDPIRCDWCLGSELMVRYHDEEWGTPVHDDVVLFEHLLLDGAQAGLSWSTILNKREGYRRAYGGFDPAVIAAWGPAEVERLLVDPGIVRNRLKVESSIRNARAVLAIQERCGSLDAFLWGFVDGRPVVNRWESVRDIPASTPLSDRVSKEMKARGFNFVGTTICYAFMQAIGMVNDHIVTCHRHPAA